MTHATHSAALLPGTGENYGSTPYRTYVLLMLTLVYTLNFVDRILIGVVAQPIIEEFKLQDWQFGLLSGFGFALMYTVIGIPIARMAESMNRVAIIAGCVVLWSVMTALCGLAGGFLSLLLFRVGVGIGEAGCTPPANSVIADYYAPNRRAKALGIYGVGVTLGGVLANLFGGPITDALSWREAFIYLGVPGIFVGILLFLTVKEPPRGATDPPGLERAERPTFREALTELASKPTYWTMSAGATVAAFVGYGVSNFTAPFFQRAHDLSVGEVATGYAVPIGLASTFGAFAGGWLTEKLSSRSPNAVAWIPAAGFVLSVPCYWIGFNTDDLSLALPTLMLGGMLHYAYLGAQYSIGQGVVGARTRATAIAILLFIVNLIGYGLGPLFVGALSDFLTAGSLATSEFGADLALTACKGGQAELLATIGAAKAAACGSAAAVGIRGALSYTICLYLLAGAGFLATCRTLQKDLVAKMN